MGERQNFTKIHHLTDDSLFFYTRSGRGVILIDSINKIYVYRRSGTAAGGVIGFLTGSILGAVIGARFSPEDYAFQSLEYATIGLAFGAISGTTLGIIAGSNRKINIDLDLSGYSREERRKALLTIKKKL